MSNNSIPEHLIRSNPSDFEVTRQRWGRGYRFLRYPDEPIEDESKLKHLRDIPVPETWTDVRLCQDPRSHILALGYDGSGKLQYLYHPEYLQYSNLQKFESLTTFGLALPRMRRRLQRDLRSDDWNERRLLALMVKILDKHHLRIGSRVYARNNQSFGLTTLRKKHLRETESDLRFEYTGKSGQEREIKLTDPSLVGLIEELSDFSGWELFSFRKGRQKVKADATKVNDYIREISGADLSARDFRTWAGTVLSVKNHHQAQQIVQENPRRKLKSTLVDLVSERLGNTTAICEEYYIHPRVLEAASQEGFDASPCDDRFLRKTLYRKHECRTMEILTENSTD